jgi:hypothetical protein
VFAELLTRGSLIVEALLRANLPSLGNRRLDQLFPPYSAASYREAQQAVSQLTGQGEQAVRAEGPGATQEQDKRDEAQGQQKAKKPGAPGASPGVKSAVAPNGARIASEIIPQVVVSSRLAFERVSKNLRDDELKRLRDTCRDRARQFLDHFYGASEGKRFFREISEDEVRRMLRQSASLLGPNILSSQVDTQTQLRQAVGLGAMGPSAW